MQNQFLNLEQIKQLKDKNWSVNENGAYLTLYSDDFSDEDIWIQICQSLKVEWRHTQKVDVLFFGVQTNP